MLDGVFKVKGEKVPPVPALVLVNKEVGEGVAYEGDVENAEVTYVIIFLFKRNILSPDRMGCCQCDRHCSKGGDNVHFPSICFLEGALICSRMFVRGGRRGYFCYESEK